MTRELKFRNPSFSERIKGMLGVDFYRLFHTPLFYIFLLVAAIIPAPIKKPGSSCSFRNILPSITENTGCSG